MKPPRRPFGITQLVKTFGDPRDYVSRPEAWEAEYLDYFHIMPYLIYAYDTSRRISRFRAHKLIGEHLVDTLIACVHAGVPLERMKFGGTYNFRGQVGSTKLSTHTWGIAIDIEPAENPLGARWSAGKRTTHGVMMDKRIIETFAKMGWKGGWEFTQRADPMHFQWVGGY